MPLKLSILIVTAAMLLIEQTAIVTVLSIIVIIFSVLLILGVRKSFLLKKENDKLDRITSLDSDDDNKAYKDFTEGHMYDNK